MKMATASPERLPRTLGLWSSVALVVGITIGSGIFRSPAGIAQQTPNGLAMLGLWVAGGVITLCGALSLAELAAALPRTGGIYAYLREAWGPRAAFLFGWSELILIRASASEDQFVSRALDLDFALASRLIPPAHLEHLLRLHGYEELEELGLRPLRHLPLAVLQLEAKRDVEHARYSRRDVDQLDVTAADQLARIVDLVGYGTANFFEGSAAAPAL